MSGDLKKIVEYAEKFLEKSLESKIFLDLLDQAGEKLSVPPRMIVLFIMICLRNMSIYF